MTELLIIKCEQVRAIDAERISEEKRGRLTESEMEMIDKKLMEFCIC